jgi:hypothetical protein
VQSPYQHRYGGQVLEGQIIHETSKKAGAHHVKSVVCTKYMHLHTFSHCPICRFGGEYVVPQATVNMVNGTRKGAAPLATFTFNYRPFGASFQILPAGGRLTGARYIAGRRYHPTTH